MNTFVIRGLGGAARGLAATAVMSAGFLTAQKVGLIGTLPPQLIVERFFPTLPDRTKRVLAVAAHLSYGMGAGALYRVLRGRSAPTGLAFGLLVWAASYEAWVPAAGVLPPAHEDDRPRALTILGAHVLYGLALGKSR